MLASKVDIIAHRGASHDAPENTLAAIKLGWEQLADGTEVDIHLSRDGEIIVMHDANCLRTAGYDGAIADLTAAELAELDAGSWKGPQFKGEPVPTLEQVLGILPLEKYFVVEIKSYDHALIPVLQKLLVRRGIKPEQLRLICFDYELIKAIKATLPQYTALWLSNFDGTQSADDLIVLCQAARLDGVAPSSHWPIDQAFVQKIKGAGLKLSVWTVDVPETAQCLVQAGVKSIITNRPAWLREQLALS